MVRRGSSIAALSFAFLAVAGCSKTEDTSPERRLFGTAPVIGSPPPTITTTQKEVVCDYQNVAFYRLCEDTTDYHDNPGTCDVGTCSVDGAACCSECDTVPFGDKKTKDLACGGVCTVNLNTCDDPEDCPGSCSLSFGICSLDGDCANTCSNPDQNECASSDECALRCSGSHEICSIDDQCPFGETCVTTPCEANQTCVHQECMPQTCNRSDVCHEMPDCTQPTPSSAQGKPDTNGCIKPQRRVTLDPPFITFRGTYTELTAQVKATDPDSKSPCPGANDILLVSASYIKRDDPRTENSIVLFDDGGTTLFPATQSGSRGMDCHDDPKTGACVCLLRKDQNLLGSGDPVNCDTQYSRAFAFVSFPAGGAGDLLENCVLTEGRQAPLRTSTNTVFDFRVDAVDRSGNITTWPQRFSIVTGTDEVDCDGDLCACCILTKNDSTCNGLPGAYGPPGSGLESGLCNHH